MCAARRNAIEQSFTPQNKTKNATKRSLELGKDMIDDATRPKMERCSDSSTCVRANAGHEVIEGSGTGLFMTDS
jgi:hypothetical protein